MYAVIFRARIGLHNQAYLDLASRLRDLAFCKYNCVDFVAVTEDSHEIAISYWRSLEDIANWKNDPEHQQAQQQGREDWYEGYKVEIVEIKNAYSFGEIDRD